MHDPALDTIEYHERPVDDAPPVALRIACYNIERGLQLDAILALWGRHPLSASDVILLSEADRGMARTANRHVTREFADALGYSWAYAVEFHELTKGSRRERRAPGGNREGHIGNAIVSRYPLRDLRLLRLPAFFDPARRFMARAGSRIALIADVVTPARAAVTVASVHLEPHSSPGERAAQMQALLAAIAERDRGQPIVLGGDMNTTGLDVHRLYRSLLRRAGLVLVTPSMQRIARAEPLFAALERAGYEHRLANREGYTFSDKGYRPHLDWFFTRNLPAAALREPMIHREFEPRWRFSDHQPVSLQLAWALVG